MFVAPGWLQRGADSATAAHLPKNQPKVRKFAAKKTQAPSRSAEWTSKVWNYDQLRR
jgi:hypothetical protein